MGSTLYKERYKQRLGRDRKKRPKTFKSAELAKAWAERNKVKSYELVDLRPAGSKDHKLRVVAK
jgi:hypothetical protein